MDNKENIQKEISEAVDVYKIEDLLKSNEYEFNVKETTYKVRKPTFKEREEAFQKKLEKYMSLLKDDNYVLENDLKKLYLKKGVDIDALQKIIDNKIRERDNFMLKLGEALKNKSPDNELEIIRKEIDEITTDINNKSIERTNLLGPSIENQCTIYFFVYLTYLVTEKKVEEKWVRAWNSFEEYQKSSSELVNRASFYASLIGGTDTLPV